MLKSPSILSLFLLILLVLKPFGSMAVVSPVKVIKPETKKTTQKVSRKEIEKKLGRKLKFKERISFWILKKKLQKRKNPDRTLPNIALVFSLAAIIPYFGIFFGLIGIILGIISIFFMDNLKYKNWYLRRALLAIIIGIVITTIHIGIVVAIAIGRSQ